MTLWADITNGQLGSAVRAILNNVGSDGEVSFRYVSAIAQVAAEISYFETGTIVFAKAERKFYKYTGAAWAVETDLLSIEPTVTEIDDGDSPFTLALETHIICDTSGGDITINLPALASSQGRNPKIKNIGAGTVTLDGSGSEEIDGATTFDLLEDESVELLASSTQWNIM